MRSIYRDSFAVLQAADVIPVDLGVSERRPPVVLRLVEEGLKGPPNRGLEELLPGVGVVVDGGSPVFGDGLQPVGGLEVSPVLSVVAIEVTDFVSGLPVAAVPDVLHYWRFRGPVLLLRHHRLPRHDWRLPVLWGPPLRGFAPCDAALLLLHRHLVA